MAQHGTGQVAGQLENRCFHNHLRLSTVLLFHQLSYCIYRHYAEQRQSGRVVLYAALYKGCTEGEHVVRKGSRVGGGHRRPNTTIFGTDTGMSIHLLTAGSLSHRIAQRCGWPPLSAAPTIAASIAAAVVRCGQLAMRPPLCFCTWHGIRRLLVVLTVARCVRAIVIASLDALTPMLN